MAIFKNAFFAHNFCIRGGKRMSAKIGGGGHQENYDPSNGRYCSSTTVDWYDQKQMYAKIEEKSEAYLANQMGEEEV